MNIKVCTSEARLRSYKTRFSSIFVFMFLGVLFFNANIFGFSLSTPVQISDGSINSSGAIVVNNSSGQAAATWVTCDSYGVFNVQAATYASGTWSTPATLGNGDEPVISINSSGDAVAAWINPLYPTEDGVGPQLWSSTYNHYTGSWSSAVQVSNTSTLATSPAIVSDDSGNAVAMWLERCNCTSDCSCGLIVCSKYSSSTYTWATPTYFTSCESHTKSADKPSIFINGFGTIMTFWAERYSSSGTLTIMSKAYENSAWNVASTVASNAAIRHNFYGGIDESGKSMVVWLATSDNGNNVQSATYSQGTWSTPSVVMDEEANITFAYSPDGNGILAWNEITNEGNIVNAMTYSGGTWSSSSNISSQVGNGGAPRVSASDTNDGAIMWGNATDTGYMQIMSLSDGSWTHTLSEPVNMRRAPVEFNLSVNSSGQIIAVWGDIVDGNNIVMATSGLI